MTLSCGCTKYVKQGTVKAVVTKKEYVPAYNSVVPITVSTGSITTTTVSTTFHASQYIVYLQYEDASEDVSDDKLYGSVDKGDEVTVDYMAATDKSGKYDIRYNRGK